MDDQDDKNLKISPGKKSKGEYDDEYPDDFDEFD